MARKKAKKTVRKKKKAVKRKTPTRRRHTRKYRGGSFLLSPQPSGRLFAGKPIYAPPRFVYQHGPRPVTPEQLQLRTQPAVPSFFTSPIPPAPPLPAPGPGPVVSQASIPVAPPFAPPVTQPLPIGTIALNNNPANAPRPPPPIRPSYDQSALMLQRERLRNTASQPVIQRIPTTYVDPNRPRPDELTNQITRLRPISTAPRSLPEITLPPPPASIQDIFQQRLLEKFQGVRDAHQHDSEDASDGWGGGFAGRRPRYYF